MSFLLIKEFVLFYVFLFYMYVYFAIDEEFIIFLVICFWLLLFIVFYMKNVSLFFSDSVESLSSEYFFFQDKKNMLLAIFRDQYYDFIRLNNFLYEFFLTFQKNLNLSINKKIMSYYLTSNLYLSELVNYFKFFFKTSLIFFYLSIFSFFNSILTLIFAEKIKFLKSITSVFFNIKTNIEGTLIKSDVSRKLLTKLNHSNNSIIIDVDNLFPILSHKVVHNFELNEKLITKELEKFFDKNHYALYNSVNSLTKSFMFKNILTTLKLKNYISSLFVCYNLKNYNCYNLSK